MIHKDLISDNDDDGFLNMITESRQRIYKDKADIITSDIDERKKIRK